MLTDGKYVVYALQPTESGDFNQTLAAVFVIRQGGFHLLEDYANLFTRLPIEDGAPIDGHLKHKLASIMDSAYLKLIPASEDGFEKEGGKLPTAPKDIHSQRQSFFYQHRDMPGPTPLIFERNHFTLNGYPISQTELDEIHRQVQSGEAKLTYPENMFKAEKDEPKSNEMDRDYVCPDILNLHAYKRLMEQEPAGYHLFMRSDAIDNVLDHDGFDKLQHIQLAVGKVLSEAAEGGKIYHLNRNSYFFNAPDHEAALLFVRNLEGLIHQLPKMFSHHPHFDIGVSDTVEGAYQALTKLESMKVVNKDDGNHVAIIQDGQFRYVAPSESF
jgi:hypothetical protein